MVARVRWARCPSIKTWAVVPGRSTRTTTLLEGQVSLCEDCGLSRAALDWQCSRDLAPVVDVRGTRDAQPRQGGPVPVLPEESADDRLAPIVDRGRKGVRGDRPHGHVRAVPDDRLVGKPWPGEVA